MSFFRHVLIAIALVMATPSLALTVSNDPGGYVDDRVQEIASLSRTQTPVRITGMCASSCTLYLQLPQTCLGPNARLGFHGPRGSKGFQGLPLQEYQRLVNVMADHYPGPIADWFRAGPAQDMDGVTWLTAKQAIRMGAKAC